MNKFSEFLMEKAAELSLTPEMEAVELLKEAGVSEEDARVQVAQMVMEKEACATLAQRGIDPEEALKLVKAADIDVSKLNNFSFDVEKGVAVTLIEKSAQYIEELHLQIQALEKAASEKDEALSETQSAFQEVSLREKRIEREKNASETLGKLNRSGTLTKEDLDQLMSVDSNVLAKVASAMDKPWDIGSGTGMARPKTDPLLEFILS